MHAHQIFQNVSSDFVSGMLQWFRDEERQTYKQALQSLAANRKLRPVFVQKKSLPEQFAWFHKTLSLKPCDMLGEHLLQAYLMQGQQQILIDFCDGLGIEHDGKGSVEGELPETLDDEKLKASVESLLEKNDRELIAVYLLVFNLQRDGGWENLAALLENDERLKLVA